MNINISEAYIYLVDNVTPPIVHEMGRDVVTTIVIAKVFSIMPLFHSTIFGLASVATALALDMINEPSGYESTLFKVIRIATFLIVPSALGHVALLAMGCSSTFASSILLTGAITLSKHATAGAWNLFCARTSIFIYPSEPQLVEPELNL
jgi:hypothetical protein